MKTPIFSWKKKEDNINNINIDASYQNDIILKTLLDVSSDLGELKSNIKTLFIMVNKIEKKIGKYEISVLHKQK